MGDNVVLAASIPEQQADFRAQYSLMTVDRTGAVQLRVDRSGQVSYPQRVASVPGVSRFAWVDHPSSGACSASDDLRTVDGTGTSSPVDPPRPADEHMRGGELNEGSRQVVSTSPAGTATVVTYGPLGGCRPVYPQRLVSYLVGGATPTYLGSGMLALAFGADGRTARIVASDPATREHAAALSERSPAPPSGLDPEAGRLDFTTADGRTSTLAAHATAIAFTPAEAAAGQAVPDPPAAPSRIDTDVTGAKIPTSTADLLAAIRTAAAAGDTAALAELCAHCVDDSVSWIRTDRGASATLARFAATHPIVYGPSVVVPGLSMQACIDTNEREQTCTAEQIADAGVLGLEPGIATGNLDGWDEYHATGPRYLVVEMRDGDAFWTGTTLAG
ncbi:hypothetical protein LWC33_07630 [Pseudonocardia sp. RS11V-5]|uniref:hypothetical protein n=1 Tax=Pseudonocardia terrae TaxID=2905831 RepID=UPI001E637868|nr:hypothetical protein [Pseudonocardia terrae]MCE3551321.1 hypothetical protein [Pseudonocardia terrae]